MIRSNAVKGEIIMLDQEKFLREVAQVSGGNYTTAFKLLGFVTYVSEYGADRLLSGSMVSLRTYYRWGEIIKAAGWESLLSDVRFDQALREYISSLEGQPDVVRQTVLSKLEEAMNEEVKNAELAA
jgi:hypothetical protein